MLNGSIYTADEMKDVGLVHMVVEPGQGIEAAREYMQRNKRRHAARARCTKRAARSTRFRLRISIVSFRFGPMFACNCANGILR